MIPNVDIYENEQEFSLLADMPGVTSDTLDIRIDGKVLSLLGKIPLSDPKAIILHEELTAMAYARSFLLTDNLDIDNIKADIRDGVLTLRILKLPESRPRKILVA